MSADVAMHQLHLTEEQMIPYDSHYHVAPPLRSKQDKNALISAVQKGIIDCICSDHQPHDVDAKLGAFPETAPGISSLETVLPLLLRLIKQGELDLNQGLATLTSEPARLLGIKAGSIAVGEIADVCVFDPDKQWQVNADTWQSQGRNTPFWDTTMKGQVTLTVQAGEIIFSREPY